MAGMSDKHSSNAGSYYGSWLPAGQWTMFAASPSDTDMADEIKLCRTMAGLLSTDLSANLADVLKVMACLINCVKLQLAQQSGNDDELLAASERALRELEGG
ncbi:MAG: hypothetical protein ACRDFS_08315 [Chloroflexota bacterium]